ncbi:ATP synthase subunit I [Lachnospiraceae bacterium 54-53]
MGSESKELVHEVSAGIILFGAAAMLASLILYPERAVFAGLFLGMVLALAMFLSMAAMLYGSVKKEDPAAIRKRCLPGSVVRYVILFAVLTAVMVRFSGWFHPVAVVIGFLGLKAGTLFQPAIHKLAVRRKKYR